ncbi:ribosome small subunit-dependent GTPase A [Gammaproteobacteria bacterium]|nr:ribosome small subunit-dependent GTPase A [Gammaproteobacteria bacterium]
MTSLKALGWKPVLQQQLTLDEYTDTVPARISAVHKDSFVLMHEHGTIQLPRIHFKDLPPLTVGDWCLLNPEHDKPTRMLERTSLIQRKAAGEETAVQLMAANVDILLIVSSCNADFNLTRLERYLALAFESGVIPIVVLTKIDLCESPDDYREQLTGLHRDLNVELVNALVPATLSGIKAYCEPGTTLAMVGSSGVGKSSIANALGVTDQATAPIREQDAKGRHTTTVRSLHIIINDSVLIDMPGMREIQLSGCESGVEELFDDLQGFGDCRFKDCSHTTEPGCALLAAVEKGEIDQRRLDSYHKLMREQEHNSESIAQRHERMRKLGKLYKTVQGEKRRDK